MHQMGAAAVQKDIVQVPVSQAEQVADLQKDQGRGTRGRIGSPGSACGQVARPPKVGVSARYSGKSSTQLHRRASSVLSLPA